MMVSRLEQQLELTPWCTIVTVVPTTYWLLYWSDNGSHKVEKNYNRVFKNDSTIPHDSIQVLITKWIDFMVYNSNYCFNNLLTTILKYGP